MKRVRDSKVPERDPKPYQNLSNITYMKEAGLQRIARIHNTHVRLLLVKQRSKIDTINNITYYPLKVKSGTYYAVFLRVYTAIGSSEIYRTTSWYIVIKTTSKVEHKHDVGILVAIILFVTLLVVALVIAVIWFLKHRDVFEKDAQEGSTRRLLSMGIWRKESRDDVIYDDAKESDVGVLSIPIYQHFAAYISEKKAHGMFGFNQDFVAISNVPKKRTDQSSMLVNKSKNRYGNILAYDESRVVLKKLDDGTFSDYINANYVDGFLQKKEYIATQGPLPVTTYDFWRMVWDECSTAIVMLTNLVEKGRVKCHQYWPDTQSQSMELNDIIVTLTDEQVFADHIVRTLRLQRGNNSPTKYIKQFHYTSWPDHGVPVDPFGVIEFVQKVNNWKEKNSASIIVHCSAGVGRTGTFIVIDTQLKRLAANHELNVYTNCLLLRSQRNFMVQTEDQYVFIHTSILEYLESMNTEVHSGSIHEYIRSKALIDSQTGINGFDIEFQTLLKHLSHGTFTQASKNFNQVKNRYRNNHPYNESRVKLSPRITNEGSDYINASYINSYNAKDHYIATQSPLKSTIYDFWRMVWESQCQTIVMLCKDVNGHKKRDEIPRYWPTNESITYGEFIITLTSEETQDEFHNISDLSVTNTQDGQTRSMKHFQCISWPSLSNASQSGPIIIELIGKVQKWNKSTDNPIIVSCSNGVGRTGVFIALANLLDRMKSENSINVFAEIKKMRHQRTAMVQTKEQYEFCYRAVEEYLESFELYDNFTG